MDSPCPEKWLEICLVAMKGDKESAISLARLLWKRHGLPGVKISLVNGEVVISHPGGIVGLESGWDRV
jgi:hypothetical protein